MENSKKQPIQFEQFQKPRHILNGDVPKDIQLHIFADAFERAYGAVAYIRASLKDSRIIVRLLCAKSRVSPLKRQTLPRLELCAAVIAAELAPRVRVDLNIQNESVYLWTDSEIVLSWINAQSSSLKTSVANRLQKSHEVDKRSCINAISSYLDPKGIIRVGCRLGNSDLHEDVKQAMVLPYNDPITKLLFISLHEENKHCGHQALLNTARQRFWPVKGKITARSVVQKCVRYTRAKPQLCEQIMGDLPQTRVVTARPFIYSGVDYCGPFWIHHRAVHLELVSDLSTSAFIGTLKRFIARRGYCQNIYSDNATNFVGAKNQLLKLAEAIYSPDAQENKG
ncbi:uncharacterized protein LOC142229613 [Haematobia irritans]|uniref:uncharacterized protein LOC142229613 n=1 Tax=Haematobia irritans TaxID=7368 RepID=UPI003F4FF891